MGCGAKERPDVSAQTTDRSPQPQGKCQSCFSHHQPWGPRQTRRSRCLRSFSIQLLQRLVATLSSAESQLSHETLWWALLQAWHPKNCTCRFASSDSGNESELSVAEISTSQFEQRSFAVCRSTSPNELGSNLEDLGLSTALPVQRAAPFRVEGGWLYGQFFKLG